MNPGVDMSVIMEALERRRAGGLGGGNPIPAGQQMSGASPVQTAPQMPQGNIGAMPQQVSQGNAANNAALQAGQKAQGPQFDPETRELGKALIQRLLKGM